MLPSIHNLRKPQKKPWRYYKYLPLSNNFEMSFKNERSSFPLVEVETCIVWRLLICSILENDSKQ